MFARKSFHFVVLKMRPAMTIPSVLIRYLSGEKVAVGHVHRIKYRMICKTDVLELQRDVAHHVKPGGRNVAELIVTVGLRIVLSNYCRVAPARNGIMTVEDVVEVQTEDDGFETSL